MIPLGKPAQLPSGELVDHITVAKGQWVTMSIHGVNQSVGFWCPDAKEFKPERWMNPDGFPLKVQEVQGHRHLLSFSDGPRFCIGRMFALAEFKVRLQAACIVRRLIEFAGGAVCACPQFRIFV